MATWPGARSGTCPRGCQTCQSRAADCRPGRADECAHWRTRQPLAKSLAIRQSSGRRRQSWKPLGAPTRRFDFHRPRLGRANPSSILTRLRAVGADALRGTRSSGSRAAQRGLSRRPPLRVEGVARVGFACEATRNATLRLTISENPKRVSKRDEGDRQLRCDGVDPRPVSESSPSDQRLSRSPRALIGRPKLARQSSICMRARPKRVVRRPISEYSHRFLPEIKAGCNAVITSRPRGTIMTVELKSAHGSAHVQAPSSAR